jgi:hypothetical protein
MKITLTHNGNKIIIGRIASDEINGQKVKFPILWINEHRYFREMGGFGFDLKLADKFSKYKYIQFDLYTNKGYRVYTEDFLAHAWRYPKEGSQFAESFEPKLVISEKVAEELNALRIKKDNEDFQEQLKYNS